jgi:DNA-binding GntR family transcriptional regulator
MDQPHPAPGSADAPGALATTEERAVVRILEEDIIFGRLAPRMRLTEDMLMARFKVTRHFVRQALLELERLGVVVREHNKGARVRYLAPEQVLKIYEVRELIQRQAALWITLPAPESLVAELSEISAEHDRYVDEGNLRKVHETNDRFHLTLFGACGNEYIVQAIEQYMRLTLPIRAHLMADRATTRIAQQQHALMIEMLKGTDNWVLAQLCVDHLQPSKRSYLEQIAASGGHAKGRVRTRA